MLKTLVVYGYPDGSAGCLALAENLEKYPQQKELLTVDCPLLLETFQAESWGEAMTYYKKKYFNEEYKSDWEGVWLPFDEMLND